MLVSDTRQFLETRFAESELRKLSRKPAIEQLADKHGLSPADPLEVLAEELSSWCKNARAGESNLSDCWRKLAKQHGI